MKKLVITIVCLCSFSISSYVFDGLGINKTVMPKLEIDNSNHIHTIISKDHILIVDMDDSKFMFSEKLTNRNRVVVNGNVNEEIVDLFI